MKDDEKQLLLALRADFASEWDKRRWPEDLAAEIGMHRNRLHYNDGNYVHYAWESFW